MFKIYTFVWGYYIHNVNLALFINYNARTVLPQLAPEVPSLPACSCYVFSFLDFVFCSVWGTRLPKSHSCAPGEDYQVTVLLGTFHHASDQSIGQLKWLNSSISWKMVWDSHRNINMTTIWNSCILINTFKYNVLCTDGKISVRINLLFYFFSIVVSFNSCVFLYCRTFIINTTFSTGLVGIVLTTKGL